ncbi:YicC/YloC family endoribonuclease [Onishia taeanensis]
MVHSMTAFARASREADWGSLELELRSVNQRYLDLTFRLPESLRGLEPGFRDALRQRLHRGKVECTLRFVPAGGETLSIHAERLAGLADALGEVRRTLPEAAMPDALSLLAHPGVLASSGPDLDAVTESAQALFREALTALVEARAREGTELAALIKSRLSAVREQVAAVKEQLPEILTRQRAQLLARLETVRAELEPQRLEAELTLMAQKADVDEELDRLTTHVGEVERQLTLKGPVGRRLDFLMQELNREANTLSSKSVVAETTRSAVELKVLIEQMREQIQNIE